MNWIKQKFTNAELIPSTDTSGYDFGPDVNEKMRALGWTPEQYDRFFDHLFTGVIIEDLITELLRYAPVDWINSGADAVGVFEDE